MSAVYIYGLIDPESDAIRYIGKSTNPKRRLSGHLREQSGCHRSHWIQGLKARGLRPEIVILERIVGAWPWQESERHWIAFARANDWPITNTTSGGDGVPDLPPKTRARIRAASVGRIPSAETRAKIGAATASRRHTDATRARMSAAHSGRKITWADKLAAAIRKLSDAQVVKIKERLADGALGCALAKEYGVHRTTISKIKKGTYHDRYRA